jgi:DNA-binding response OmpR family regulator/two-component sensor histidine kinase
LTALINDLLDLTKIEAGKMEFEEKELIIEDVIKSAIDGVNSFAKERNIKIKTDLEGKLPTFIGDEEKLTLLMTHLLNNAIKFNKDNGLVEIKATRLKEPKEEIQISVKDTGIGIAPQHFEVIFEKFKKIEESILTSEYQGAGLGLALCKEIVMHYKGKIWVESELNKGSTFYFTLPILPIKAQKPLSSLTLEQPKILIVDDEPDIRQFLNFELTKQGYCVIEAGNGKEAIEQANKFHPNLILLDILMPEMDGFEVLKSLKGNPKTKDIPVIILSIIEEKKKGYKLGAKDYITKPIDKTLLLEKIQSILTTSRKEVLLISNNEKIIKTLKFGLDRKGVQVEVANDIERALFVAKKQPFDSVILDAKLDREINTDIPIIILEDGKTKIDLEDKWIKSLSKTIEEILEEHKK